MWGAQRAGREHHQVQSTGSTGEQRGGEEHRGHREHGEHGEHREKGGSTRSSRVGTKPTSLPLRLESSWANVALGQTT